MRSNNVANVPDLAEKHRRIVIRLLIGFVRVWQTLFSAWMAPSCRFVPSCSDYSIQALREHGPWMGSWLTIRRLSRCHPFGGSGLDEVPPCTHHRHQTHDACATAKDTSNGYHPL